MWLDRSYLNGTHPFAALLAGTPSLTGAVAGTERLGEFHASVAATSLLIALAGMALATYLYCLSPAGAAAVAGLPGTAAAVPDHQRRACAAAAAASVLAVGGAYRAEPASGWLARIVVDVVRLLALVLSAPLLLSRFISPYRLSYGKFYLDEIYNVLIVGRGPGCGAPVWRCWTIGWWMDW